MRRSLVILCCLAIVFSMDDFGSRFSLGTAPQVWLFSDYDGYNWIRTQGYPPYLTQQQVNRLERIRQARLLHDGRHKRLFWVEGRTQCDFPQMKVNGHLTTPYVPYNLLRLITRKSADLLFGDEPAVKVTDEIQQQKLAALVKRTSLHALLYASAAEATVDAEAFIESVIQQGEVYLKRVDAADIFPVGLLQPDGQYESYVRYNAKNVGTEDNPEWRLLITRYIPGAITRELRPLDRQGVISPKVLTLDQWPQEDPAAEPLEPETRTGLDRASIVWVPNELVRDIAVSMYDGLVECQDAINAKQTQIFRVLAKHADPKLAAPRAAADPQGRLPANHEVFFFGSKDEIPQYLTWHAELASALEDRREMRSAMLTLAEMSPILLGIKDGASSHNNYKGVRLEAMNSITKAARMGVIWKAAIGRLITLAQDMEQTIPGNRYDRMEPGVEMRDGLPADTDTRANELKTLRDADLLSVERGVEILIQDPPAVQKELAALAREAPSGPAAAGPGAGTAPAASAAGLAADASDETKQAALEIAA